MALAKADTMVKKKKDRTKQKSLVFTLNGLFTRPVHISGNTAIQNTYTHIINKSGCLAPQRNVIMIPIIGSWDLH